MWQRSENWGGLLKGVSLTGKIGVPAEVRYSFLPDNMNRIIPPNLLRLMEYTDGTAGPLRQYLMAFFIRAASTWSEVAAITFKQDDIQPNFLILEANMTISANAITIPRFSPTNPHHLTGVILFVSTSYLTKRASQFFSTLDEFYYWWFNIFIHEIGHGLGFKHPGDKLIPDMPGIQQPFNIVPPLFDNNCFTVMSYNKECGNFFVSVRSLDIAAAQYLYGPAVRNSFDTGYSLMKIFEAANKMPERMTVWDNRGADTISGYPFDGEVVIDLRSGEDHFSQIGNVKVSIALDSAIENAEAGCGDNIIFGNNLDNVIDLRLSNGKSVIHFLENFGHDVIYGFKTDKDLLNISKVPTTTKLILNCRATYNGMKVEFPNGNSIELKGIKTRLDQNIIGNFELHYDCHILLAQILDDPKYYIPLSIFLGLFADKFKHLGKYSHFLGDFFTRTFLPVNGYLLQQTVALTKKQYLQGSENKDTSKTKLIGRSALSFSVGVSLLGLKTLSEYFQPLLPIAIGFGIQMCKVEREDSQKGFFNRLKNCFWKSIPGYSYLNKTASCSEATWESYIKVTAKKWQNYVEKYAPFTRDNEDEFNYWVEDGIKNYCIKKGIKRSEFSSVPIYYSQIEEYLLAETLISQKNI